MKTILISAFSCSPNHGSEPGVGWNWSTLAAELDYKVIVLTRTKLKNKIEEEVKKLNIKNISYIYVDSSSKLRNISIYLEYIDWQRRSYRYLKKHFDFSQIDYIWFLTMGNMYLPTWVYKFNKPLIWGPVGGGENVERSIYKNWKFRYKFPFMLKDFLIDHASIFPYFRGLCRNSSKILVRTSSSIKAIPPKYRDKVEVSAETFLKKSDFEFFDTISSQRNNSSFTYCYDGRLTPFKNVYNLCLAYNNVKDKLSNSRLIIIGDGEELEAIGKIGFEQIELKGQLPREQILNEYVSKCDCFIFPSLREGSSWSLIEAMVLKKMLICTDANGVGDMTSDSCALRVHIDKNITEAELVNNLEKLLIDSYSLSNQVIDEMGEDGYQRVVDWYSEEKAKERIKRWFG